MIYYPHFKDLCVRTLKDMRAYKPEAVLAVSMIVGHESSGGKYLVQGNKGPARGIIQMEGWVHNSVWDNCDNILVYASRLQIEEDVAKLEYDLRYNIFMARCRLIMDTNPLPLTERDMAKYLKRYWNSEGGKASAQKYQDDYSIWINT
jgi:hypothetical protein